MIEHITLFHIIAVSTCIAFGSILNFVLSYFLKRQLSPLTYWSTIGLAACIASQFLTISFTSTEVINMQYVYDHISGKNGLDSIRPLKNKSDLEIYEFGYYEMQRDLKLANEVKNTNLPLYKHYKARFAYDTFTLIFFSHLCISVTIFVIFGLRHHLINSFNLVEKRTHSFFNEAPEFFATFYEVIKQSTPKNQSTKVIFIGLMSFLSLLVFPPLQVFNKDGFPTSSGHGFIFTKNQNEHVDLPQLTILSLLVLTLTVILVLAIKEFKKNIADESL